MNANGIRPLYLIKENVEVIEDDPTFEGIGVAQRIGEGERASYKIRINRENVRELLENSWLFYKNIDITEEDVYIGVLVHEIGHIKYGHLLLEPKFDDELFQTIWNILADNNDEFQMTRDHPIFVMNIRVLLSCLKRSVKLNTGVVAIDSIEKRIEELFYLTRFGIPIQGADMDFINFCLPLVLTSTRSTSQSAFEAAHAIYIYLTYNLNHHQKQILKANVSQQVGVVKSKDMANVKSAVESGRGILASPIQDMTIAPSIKEFFSKGAGSGDNSINIEENDTGFFRKTVEAKADFINELQRLFKLRVNASEMVAASEGDLNFLRQQDAYVSSFSLEGTLDYLSPRRVKISKDFVIMRDTSSSIRPNEVKYAELTVSLLAALSDLSGIRVAEVDFSNGGVVNLEFDSILSEARINPVASGGTDALSGFRKVEELNWQSSDKYLIIITDGDFYSPEECERKEQELRDQGIKLQKFHIGYTEESGVIQTSFDTFHYDIAEWLLDII